MIYSQPAGAMTPNEVPLSARVISGESLKKLNSIAKSSPSIASPRFSTIPTHVCIMASIPNIRVKFHGPHNYTECIYNNTPQSTIQTIKNDMKEIANTIISRGAKPIFGTIAPINILKYNTFLKEKRKTSTLKHSHTHTHQYDDMQQKGHNHIITELIEHIKSTNSSNDLATPFFHMDITKRRSKRGGVSYRTIHWDNLYDGLHATQHTKLKWANTLKSAIARNRGNNKRKHPFSPTHTNSRSWKNEGLTNTTPWIYSTCSERVWQGVIVKSEFWYAFVYNCNRSSLSLYIYIYIYYIYIHIYVYIYIILLHKLNTTSAFVPSGAVGAPAGGAFAWTLMFNSCPGLLGALLLWGAFRRR